MRKILVRQPAEQDDASRTGKERHGRCDAHLGHFKTPGFDEIAGQPGQETPKSDIKEEKADEGPPYGRYLDNLPEGDFCLCRLFRMVFFEFIQFGLADALAVSRIVGNKELNQQSHNDARDEQRIKDHAPAPGSHDSNDEQRCQCRPEGIGRHHEPRRRAAVFGREPVGNRPVRRGRENSFTDAKGNADQEHVDEIIGKACNSRKYGPPSDAGKHYLLSAEAVCQKAAGNLTERIAYEKGTHDAAHSDRCQPEFIRNVRNSRSHDHAVQIGCNPYNKQNDNYRIAVLPATIAVCHDSPPCRDAVILPSTASPIPRI